MARGVLCVSCNISEGAGNPKFEDYRANPPAVKYGLELVYDGHTDRSISAAKGFLVKGKGGRRPIVDKS